ncbi:Serpentine receptor class delta-44 [Caenorhabditis elegans]|uniref:Serpentine receptor class delta-44 n=1 Tax=Caenorhabditis elegans TaxID=6239 RepID=SRD44_CAEEL|nr:Serpentine receptor class delta-44 [Caenorhabditis elegans]O17823.2 RecName: Full=Serpentine receptor class delta-44; Short=Protein srd-44 [Caenorhabditis elegans]CAA92163.1 Serpentine receptor class delta-44 [Caenorhabditis elegans]|eukprot:NP_510068.1 Serpentine receptor class delta-44 [Caenorhabditis elegans]
MFRKILSVLNPTVFVLSLCFQIILIYTIIRHSPKNLSTLKAILLTNCCFQLLQSSMVFFTQIQLVNHLVPIELWSYGPCRHFEAFMCYSMFHILQTSSLVSGLTVFLTTFMKYQAARHVRPSKKKNCFVILFISSIVLISAGCGILLVIIQALPLEIREKYYRINLELDEYSVIGIVDYSVLPSRVNGIIINGLVVIVPITCLLLRRKILKLLTASSDALYFQNRVFLQGLTLQIFGHTLVYVPIFICSTISLITKTEYTFAQFFIFVLPHLTTVIDPLLTMYFVTPYRKRLMVWLRLKNDKVHSVSPSTFAVSANH